MGRGRRSYCRVSSGCAHFSAECHLRADHGARSILRFPDPQLRAAVGRDRARSTTTCVSWSPTWPRRWWPPNGAGLAAIQVGAPVRLFIVDGHVAGGAEDSPPKVFINPEIVEISDEAQTGDEGCLSFPDSSCRSSAACARGCGRMDLDGQMFEAEGEGLFARALQHETDHLNGRLLIDQVGPVKREIIKRKLRKDARGGTGRGGRAGAGARGALASAGAAFVVMLTIALSAASSSTAATAPPPSSAARTRKFEVDVELEVDVGGRRAERPAGRHRRLQQGRRGHRRHRHGRAAPPARVAGAPDDRQRARPFSAVRAVRLELRKLNPPSCPGHPAYRRGPYKSVSEDL